MWHDSPMRRGLAWLFALPLMLAGSQAAHVLAYRWVYPSTDVRLHALFVTGHGYLDRLPFVLAAGAVVLVPRCVGRRSAARGRPLLGGGVRAAAAGRVRLQEVLERSVHSGTFVWQAVEAPTFLPGLALQLPFALVAFLVARLLLGAAEHAGHAAPRPPLPGASAAAARRLARPLRPLSLAAWPSARRRRSFRVAVAAGTARRFPTTLEGGSVRGNARLLVPALAAAAALAVLTTAWAHAIMSPPVALKGKLQQFTLSVPTEEEGATTTEIELTVPTGFGIDSFEPPPAGWKMEADDRHR